MFTKRILTIFFIIAICLIASLTKRNLCHAALILEGQLYEHGEKLSAEQTVKMTLRIYDEEFNGQLLFEENQEIDSGPKKSLFTFEKGDITVRKRTSNLATESLWVEVESNGQVMTPRLNLAEIGTVVDLTGGNLSLVESSLRTAGEPTLVIDDTGVTLGGLLDMGLQSINLGDVARNAWPDWSNLEGIPADFADGTDDDSGGDITAVISGVGLSGGAYSGDASLEVTVPLALGGNTTSTIKAIIEGRNEGDGYGLRGWAQNNYGVHSYSENGSSIMGMSYTQSGVIGLNSFTGNTGSLGTENYGVYGKSYNNYSGYFDGDTKVTGQLHTDGNVGIGTDSPTEKLDIDGNAKISGNLLISNNLGIGVDNPVLPLYIRQTEIGLTYPLKVENKEYGNESGESDVGILFSSGGSGTDERGKGALVYEATTTWNRGSFHFLQDSGQNTYNPDMSDSVITITNSGRLGIGTTAPESLLDVNGDGRIRGDLTVDDGITFSDGIQQTAAATPSWHQILPAAERFELVMNNEAVLDRETGMVWERDTDATKYDWFMAQEHCYKATIGGRGGWRLPTIEELKTLDDPTQSNPALPNGHPFTRVQLSSYWSSTTQADFADGAWLFSFASGNAGYYYKSYSYYVRAVRSGQ